MDFKSLRSDKLKLTQEEFANLYGISIQEVQELDKTGKPDMDLIVKIATKSGLDFNTILSYEKPRVKPISAKDTWEKTNFTKKSLSGYEEKGVTDQYRKAINEYWAQTETAFDQAAEQLDQAWTAYVERLQTTVDSYDIEQIETSLTAAKGIQNFFEHIPL